MPEAAREPVPRTLLGTWTGTVDYSSDYDVAGDLIPAGSLVHTLTFTRSRWILHVTRVPDDGSPGHRWAESGTWQSKGGTVTRTWVEHDAHGRRIRSVAKTFYWGDDAGDVLFIHPWGSLQPVDGEIYERYSRVRDPLPSPPTGVWRGTGSREDEAGETWEQEYVVTINTDGMFLSVEQRAGHWRRELVAQWTADEGEYFLYLTEPTAFGERAGEDRMQLFPEIVDASVTARIAYAPTDRSPAEIVVSPYGNEPDGRRSCARTLRTTTATTG